MWSGDETKLEHPIKVGVVAIKWVWLIIVPILMILEYAVTMVLATVSL